MSRKIVHIDVALTRAPEPTGMDMTKTAFEIIEDMLSVSPVGLVRKLLKGTPAAVILEKHLSGGMDS